jgi:hypothetical protein
MTHGGKLIEVDDYVDDPAELRWLEVRPWEWALGEYGTVRGFGGPPWTVEIHGRPAERFRTLVAARRALEDAALADSYAIIGDGESLAK